MSRCAARRPFGVLFGALQLSAVAHAGSTVSTAELTRCAAITGANERLACYDSLAHRVLPSAAPAAASAAAPAAIAAGGAAAAAAAAPAAPSASVAKAQDFGLTRHQETAPDQPDLIKAVVKQLTGDRQGNLYVQLDNAQTWTFNAQDTLLRVGDTVTIKRAALGSYLVVLPDHHSYHAKRVQ